MVSKIATKAPSTMPVIVIKTISCTTIPNHRFRMFKGRHGLSRYSPLSFRPRPLGRGVRGVTFDMARHILNLMRFFLLQLRPPEEIAALANVPHLFP